MQNDATVIDAGCVDTPDAAAGCVPAAGDRPADAAATPGADDSAGCATEAPAGSSEGKAAPPTTVREFERALRGLGFTRKQAADIARQGFNPATAAAELDHTEPDETQRLREAMQAFARSLKG
ncbi:MAG: hypothetical protein H6933_04815 [Burkholderiaceae bacterium]|nr:hypothetical protein [Rhodoferax sp.]MCP5284202.1 hypothetical protein [Burkholderiaceae bacterium]